MAMVLLPIAIFFAIKQEENLTVNFVSIFQRTSIGIFVSLISFIIYAFLYVYQLRFVIKIKSLALFSSPKEPKRGITFNFSR